MVTDLTMPKINGLELANKLMRSPPGVTIILRSGFGALIGGKDLSDACNQERVLKPFVAQDFAESIRRVLSRSHLDDE